MNEVHWHRVATLWHCLSKFERRCGRLLVVYLTRTAEVSLRARRWLNCWALSLRILWEELRWDARSWTLFFDEVHRHLIESRFEVLYLLLLGKLLLLLVYPLTFFDKSIFDSKTGWNVNQTIIVTVWIGASMLISNTTPMRGSIGRRIPVVSGVVGFGLEGAIFVLKLGLLLQPFELLSLQRKLLSFEFLFKVLAIHLRMLFSQLMSFNPL